MKTNLKILIAFVLGLIVSGSISVIAYAIASKDVSYDNTKSHSQKENVQGAIDELYVKTKNRYDIYYVGELNRVTGNNGAVTSRFDVRNIYPNYQSLTVDNFIYAVDYMYNHWDNNVHLLASANTLNKTYNSNTGILTIVNCYQVNSFNSGFHGKVYLVPDISNINQ